MSPGFWGIVVIVFAILLLFGRGKISGMMGEVASGIKAFQRGMSEDPKPVERLDTEERDKSGTDA